MHREQRCSGINLLRQPHMQIQSCRSCPRRSGQLGQPRQPPVVYGLHGAGAQRGHTAPEARLGRRAQPALGFGDGLEFFPRRARVQNLLGPRPSFARGNENNLSQPDGTYYLGPGTSPGYGVTNIGARYQALKHLQLFIQVNNLFNHRYYTGSQLGPTAFTATGNFAARPLPAVNGEFPVPQSTFYAPGTPRNFQGGLKLTF